MKLEVKPLSVNQAWKFSGKIMYCTKAYEQLKKDVFLLTRGWKKTEGWIEMSLEFHIRRFKASDVDNFAKTTIDALMKAEVIDDDKFIKKLTLEKFLSPKGEPEFIMVKIEKYEQT